MPQSQPLRMGEHASRVTTKPLQLPRTVRGHQARTLTSMPAGKVVPVFMAPLLREDAVRRGNLRLSFQMYETAEILLNAVNVEVRAYLVPWLAMDRFISLDEFNKSYKGLPYKEGEDVIPFFETHAMPDHGASEFYKYAGLHAKPGAEVNTMYLEAYNQIWNYRAKNRSPDLELRDRLDDELAPAFWTHEQYANIVPDFDQARIDGEVPLNVTNPEESRLPVRGFGNFLEPPDGPSGMMMETGTTERRVYEHYAPGDRAGTTAMETDEDGHPLVFAQFAEELGITVSLSNIELARKTAAFARMRERYNQHSEEYLIDLLMDGISVPEQEWQHPMLIGADRTIFGMAKRYATSSGALDESAVNGATFIDMTIRTPRVSTGGVVMVTAEVTPEQLFERNKDAFFHLADAALLPEGVRDELDPEKVSVVENSWVDIDHDDEDDTFGYAPLNHEWDVRAPKVGGRFYRPEVDEEFDEDRQRIWAVETENPTLSTDFYLCTNIHQKPFLDREADPFEVVVQGQLFMSGYTVFGRALMEASDDYEKILAKAPQDRIEKPTAAEE